MQKIILLLLFATSISFLRAQSDIVLENEYMKAIFTPRGELVQLINKRSSWQAVSRRELGESFQMLVPIEGKEVDFMHEKRFHVIGGKEQDHPQIIQGRNFVTFRWSTLRSRQSPHLEISFAATASINEKGMIFSGEVENKSPYSVEYISWPYLGEVAPPDKSDDFRLTTKNYIKTLMPTFPSEQGYWGVDYPTTLTAFPNDGFMILGNDKEGLYFSTTDKSIRGFIIGSLELIPGFGVASHHPMCDEMDGQKVRIAFKANHVLYAHPHSRASLTPVFLTFYQGSPYKGANIYKNRAKEVEGWLSEPQTWREVAYTGKQRLLEQARESVDCGVKVLLMNGWYRNGDDNFLDIAADLNAGIEECQQMGIKIILESDFTRTSSSTSLYRSEFRDLIVSDPYGYFYNPFILCPLSRKVDSLVQESFSVMYDTLHADGAVCTDVPFRIKTIFCHQPDHGHRVAAYTANALCELDRRFAREATQKNKDFKTGGIYQYDAQQEYFHFMLLPGVDRNQMTRYVHPGLPIVAPVDVRKSRQDINTAVLYNYIICYGPLFKTGLLKNYPHLVRYTQAIETFRGNFSDYLWHGEMIADDSVRVTGGNISYTLFQRKSDGKKAVVIVNDNMDSMEIINISFGTDTEMYMASPENPHLRKMDGAGYEIEPQSLIIVIE